MCIFPVKSTKMWPMYVDYSDEDCRRAIRSLELEAYSNIVSAFRAQGSLSKERRKMLQDLCSMLNISMERHRAEIRRAVNDEHLNTIAERLFGPNTATDWAIEGRRVVPLMPRLAPQTVFTAVADSAANAQASKNAELPLPSKTGVRQIGNGVETMASRKRKGLPYPDSSSSPFKISALDSQYFNNLCFDNASTIPETSQTIPGPANSDSFSPPDSTSQVSSSFTEQAPVKTTASILTSSVLTSSPSPAKPLPKQIMLKSSSTATTFPTFDQLNTNLLSSRPTSHSPVPTAVHEEQISTASDVSKISSESKSFQRSTPSITVKTPSIMATPVSSSLTSTSSSDRLSLPSSASSALSNKFLTQIRGKNTGHARQNLNLGLKLNSQSPMGQKGISPKSSTNLKVKDQASSFFTKKLTQTVFSSPSSDSSSQFSLSSATESTSATKSSITVSKSSIKTDLAIVSSSQPSNKLTTVTKSFPKTSAPSSMTRSFFSTATKPGAKSLSPVIFNVSSTSGTSLQTTTKTTVSAVPSESPKTTPQLLPKSTSVGLTPSHLKINASNSQTIQYRNEGVMRSARIVNISQPGGSRLPCGISPSTISALGLASNLTSTPLRVTLPPGTLNTSASMRVSTAAKPNVIVVHKAQMWPRTQTAAVIMSSSASLPKIPNDDLNSLAQKQEKSRLSGAKLAPRPIAPVLTSTPAVSASTLKIPDTSLLANPLANKSTPPERSPDNTNPKSQENSAENQCKKNLLAEAIEASGLLLETGPDKISAAGKDKNKILKDEKVQSSFLESETKSFKKSLIASLVSDPGASIVPQVVSKAELTKTSETESIQSADFEKNGVGCKSREVSVESKEISESLVSSSQVSENSSSTAENSMQKEVCKEKNS